MIFREFREKDIYDIAEIFQLVNNDERKPEDYLKWLDYPEFCKNFVVEKDGHIIGRLLLDQFYLLYPEFINFAIHPKYQGKGIGQEIVKFTVKKCLEAENDFLVIPILKNDYTNITVKEFYKKLDFIPIIKGSSNLNEWRMNFKNYSLIKGLLSSSTSSKLIISSTFPKFSPYFRRNYEFKTNSKEDLIKHKFLSRSKNVISFQNCKKEKVIFTIIGQPDQPIGKIKGKYCVPGSYPAIYGVEILNTKYNLNFHFQDINEFGECELICRNYGNSEISFDLKLKTLPNVIVKGVPKKLTLNSNQVISYRIRVNLGNKFNPAIFDYTSFESIPITIIFKNEERFIQPFHITINFWYHILV